MGVRAALTTHEDGMTVGVVGTVELEIIYLEFLLGWAIPGC